MQMHQAKSQEVAQKMLQQEAANEVGQSTCTNCNHHFNSQHSLCQAHTNVLRTLSHDLKGTAVNCVQVPA